MKKLREKSFGGKIHGIWNYLQQHDEVILQKIPIILLSYAHGFPPHVWTHPLKRELCFNRSQPICLEVGRGNFRPVFGCRQYTSISEKDLLQRTYNFPLKQTRCIFVIPKCDLIKSMKWCSSVQKRENLAQN